MNVSRRTVLKAAGVSLTLPFLSSLASEKSKRNPPVRSLFIALGYGVTEQKWFPPEGNDYKMPEALMPLNDLRDDFSIIQNLTVKSKVSPHGSSASFLTTGQLQSCDQVAGELVGQNTRFQTLELNASEPKQSGHGCGISLARNNQGNPLPGINGPLDLYLTMFGSPDRDISVLKKTLAKEKSLLDILNNQRASLFKKTGTEDHKVLDEYYTSIRSLEKKISRSEKWLKVPLPKPIGQPPQGNIPISKEIQITYDLIALAFKADLSRVVTYVHPMDSVFKELGFSATPHNMSHYGKDPELLMPISLSRDQFNTKQFAHLIKTFKATSDWDGSSLLDNCMIAFGTPCRAGHNCKNGPILFAGKGGGKVKQGQNIIYKEDKTPLSNLWYSMLKNLDSRVEKFSASNKFMNELFV